MIFRDIQFPETFQYSSDSENIPLEFYESTFPIAKEIDLLLGYFSSNAFKVLSESFAEFIFNGGTMRIITNHIFSLKDKENLLVNNKLESEDEIIDIFGDIEKLEKELSEEGKHFFDCLKFLIKHDRLKILPVKFNHMELAHCKKMILYDGIDYISTDGSINFTLSALIKNSESFNVNVPWEGEIFKKRISTEKHNFDKIFNKEHSDYEYLNSYQIESVINKIGRSKEIQDLLEDSVKIDNSKFNNKIKKILELKKVRFEKKVLELKTNHNQLKFPYDQPYPYQEKAYDAWVKNNYSGLFAMATGTGKTLTALYCLINEYAKTKKQKNIFVVPGEELVNQWYKELTECNFKNIYKWFSNNKNLKNEISNIEILKNSDSLNIVITYDSFKLDKFQRIFKSDFTDFVVVFDETHKLGANQIKNTVGKLKFNKKIGLSATPLRLWDDNGSNDFIETFFDSTPPYTYSYSMEDAIKNGFLCKYKYYPTFTNLTDDEWGKYLEYTAKIPFGKDGDINTTAALKRQLVLDQAENKKFKLIEIVKGLIQTDNFKYTLVYCPKGTDDDDRHIHELGSIISKKYNKLNIQFFLGETKERPLLLREFEEGVVDMLFAIKCLDEGVNIPKTMNAIFLASGRNYREFVQRRGRVLRNYKNGDFVKTHANIYDVVVLPSIKQYNNNSNTALKLIVNEFKRLFEFNNMAIYDNTIFYQIEDELKKYELTQYYIEDLITNNNL